MGVPRLRIALALGLAWLAGCEDERAEPLASMLRPTDPAEPAPGFGASEVVESVATADGVFRIHFTRAGANAVPAADVDANGVPDFVDLVEKIFAEVYTLYHDALGFDVPPDDAEVSDGNGGDARFDVYLVNFGGVGDGAFRRETCFGDAGCAGYMLIENDFTGYGYTSIDRALRILVSHEYFHSVQAGYVADVSTVLSEGTAVWGTERFAPTTTDLEGFSSGFFERPDRTFASDPIGPVQSSTYGAGVFFYYLSSQYGDGVIVDLFEALRGGSGAAPVWLATLDEVLVDSEETTFADVFAEFHLWNLYTGMRADADNYYSNGAQLPLITTTPLLLNEADRFRSFPASAHVFEVAAPFSSSELEIHIRDEDNESFRYVVAAVTSSGVRAVESGVGDGESVHSIAIEADDEPLIVSVVDPRMSGSSRFLTACVQSEDSDACASSSLQSDAGVPSPQDAGGIEVVDAGEVSSGGGSGCSLGTSKGRGSVDVSTATLLFLVGSIVLRRTRRPSFTRS